MFQIGIDEAGYGPNLGPLVQAAVVLRVPAKCDDGWLRWRPAFAAHWISQTSACWSMILSSLMSACRASNWLEQSIFGCVLTAQTLDHLLSAIACGPTLDDLADEPWYRPETALPLAAERSEEFSTRHSNAQHGPQSRHRNALAASGRHGDAALQRPCRRMGQQRRRPRGRG